MQYRFSLLYVNNVLTSYITVEKSVCCVGKNVVVKQYVCNKPRFYM